MLIKEWLDRKMYNCQAILPLVRDFDTCAEAFANTWSIDFLLISLWELAKDGNPIDSGLILDFLQALGEMYPDSEVFHDIEGEDDIIIEKVKDLCSSIANGFGREDHRIYEQGKMADALRSAIIINPYDGIDEETVIDTRPHVDETIEYAGDPIPSLTADGETIAVYL